MRLDVFLTLAGACPSRTRSQRLIESGAVSVNGKLISRSSYDVDENDKVELYGGDMRYVSRGGLKLEAAIKSFGIEVSGMTAVDIGASTGGFTDCMLQYGASRVYAIDSGREQLHPSLRTDPRVVSIEGFNARELDLETVGESCDIVTMDVSFISQTLLYPAVMSVLREDGVFISLIKPQFEAGRGNIGKNGIVRDKSIHADVLVRITAKAALDGLLLYDLIRSPIEGGDGNVEYLALFRKKNRSGTGNTVTPVNIRKIVYGN